MKVLFLLLLAQFAPQQKPCLGLQINYGHPLADGLVGCWLMNEGSGCLIATSTNYILNSTSINGSVNCVVGKHGVAIDFNNTGSFSLPTAPSQCLGTNPRTIVFSFNATAFDTDLANPIYMLGNGGAGVGSFLAIYAEDNGISLGVYGHRVIWNKSGLSTGTYYQFAVTFPGNTTSDNFTGYIDGVYYAAATEAGSAQTVNTIGTHIIGGEAPPTYFNGILEYVYLYDRALTASEILQLYHNPFCIFEQDNIAVLNTGIPVSGAPPPQIVRIYLGAMPIFAILFICLMFRKSEKCQMK